MFIQLISKLQNEIDIVSLKRSELCCDHFERGTVFVCIFHLVYITFYGVIHTRWNVPMDVLPF